MLCALSFCLCLQNPPQISLKPLWKLPPSVQLDEGLFYLGSTAMSPDRKSIRVLSGIMPGSRGRLICDIDLNDGSIHVLNTVTDQGGGGFVGQSTENLTYLLGASGYLMAAHSGGGTYELGILDPYSLDPLIQFAGGDLGFPIAVDEAQAAKEVLPFPFDLTVSTIGHVHLLFDSPKTRLMIVKGELRSYKPGTWIQDGDPLLTTATFKDVKSWDGATLIGNPDIGPFAVTQAVANSPSRTAFFNTNFDLLNVDPKTTCLDAGPNGILVDRSPNSIACLDPEEGKQIWAQSRGQMAPPILWDGDYVVGIQSGYQKGYSLHVTDGSTGETVANVPASKDFLTMQWVIGDVIVLRDGQTGSFMAAKLTSS